MSDYAGVGESVLEAFANNMFPDPKESEVKTDIIKMLEAKHDLTNKGIVLRDDGNLTSYVEGGPVVTGLVLAERITLAKRKIEHLQEAIVNMTAILESPGDKK